MNWEKNLKRAKDQQVKAPDGYFDELEDVVIKAWKEKSSEPRGMLRKMIPWFGMAAAGLAVLIYFTLPVKTDRADILAQMDSEQAAYYYLQTSDISVAELWLDTENVPADTIESWLLSDASLDGRTIEELY